VYEVQCRLRRCRWWFDIHDREIGGIVRCPRCDHRYFVVADEEPWLEPIGEMNYAAAFLWWRNGFHGRVFPYRCRGCDNEIPLRSRVTQTRRSCPGCGRQFDQRDIDQQLDDWEPERQRILRARQGCGALGVVAFFCAAAAVLV